MSHKSRRDHRSVGHGSSHHGHGSHGGRDHYVDPLRRDAVYFNDEFNEELPMYFLDSGVVVTFGLIKLLEDARFSEYQIKEAVMRGMRDTINGEEIEGNRRNIDNKTIDVLYNLYKENKKGKVVFCVPPTVYKEIMLDGKKHDSTQKQYSRKFLSGNCFLAFPNEDFTLFARKTLALQEKLKTVSANGGEYGLCPDYKERKIDGVRYLIDANIKDRMIISEVAVLTKQSRKKVNFISCQVSNQPKNDLDVKLLFDEERRVDTEEIEPLKADTKAGRDSILIQINSMDMGKRQTSRRGGESFFKNQVAEKLEKVIDEFFAEDGSMKVITPDELSGQYGQE